MTAVRWRYAPMLAGWYWSDDGGISWYALSERAP